MIDFDHEMFALLFLKVWIMMHEDPMYFPAFTKSQLYIKLLAELDLLHNPTDKPDDALLTSPQQSIPQQTLPVANGLFCLVKYITIQFTLDTAP